MKKVLSLVLCLALTLSVFALASAETAPAYKLGLGIVTSIDSSADASADADGKAQSDSTAVAALIGADGKLVDVALDVAQIKMSFSAKGVVTTDPATEYKNKNELGEAYGMKAASPIGKEWDEQAAFLREYFIGKTIDEIKGIAVDEKNHPTAADLTAGCTMAIGDFTSALVFAMENAVDCTAAEGDKLSLGIVTDTAEFSKDAAADAEGACQIDDTYAAITLNAEGVITACALNCSQSKIKFDATGKITSDLTALVVDKKALGEAYGMKVASAIGKEWFEQAAGFEAYVIGKTAEQIQGIAVNEEAHPTDADIVASCSMSIGSFQAAIAKAAK
ncbi:MAG: hypothetical protein RR065_11235 [Clostridia bacterium]